MDQSLVSLAVAEKYLLFVHSFDHQLRGLRLPHGKDTACGRGRESRAGATGRGHRDMGDLGWHLKCNHLEPGLCRVPGVRNLLKDTGNFRFGLSEEGEVVDSHTPGTKGFEVGCGEGAGVRQSLRRPATG